MSTQPTLALVTFTRPFSISGIGHALPPGTYQLVTQEQPGSMSTMLHLPASAVPGPTSRIVQVDAGELAAALAADAD
jgi:hypothetical protein